MNYVIIDIETTGGSPKESKITEIAIYKHNGKELIDHFETLINPEIVIPDFIVNLTGITNQMVQNAPKFYEIAKEIVEFTQDCVFVAHNVSFDYRVVRHEFKLLGYDYRRSHLCTVTASRKIIPGYDSYSLGKLSRQLGIEIKGRHRAGGDALATVKLFEILVKENEEMLKSFIHEDIDPNQLNSKFDISSLDEIPEKQGVYKLYNEFNQLLYVAQAKQLRKSVEQHLKVGQLKSTGLKMLKEITHFDYSVIGSELISKLILFQERSNSKPKFNDVKHSGLRFGVYDYPDEKGYLRLTIDEISKNKNIPFIKFSTKKQAEEFLQQQVFRYQLCKGKIGNENTLFECSEASSGRCKGACTETEPVLFYNKRVEMMLQEVQFENESFVILESGRRKGEKSFLLVQNGEIKGYGFAPYHFQFQPNQKWNRYLQPFSNQEELRFIVQNYIYQNESLNLVRF
jgi:DNA polymerase-3 subunit epsilon